MQYEIKDRQTTRHFYELLIRMTEKELETRYKNTFFGFLWVVINPLMQMFVIGFTFKFFVKEPIDNYYLYLLVGLLVWNFFNLSLMKSTGSIVNERGLIKKSKFPKEVIPLSIILSNIVHLLIAFALLLVPAFIGNLLTISSVYLLFFGLTMLLIFTTGLSLLTAALNVKYRDTSFFVQAILMIWFYATPIVYSINSVPKNLIWIWRLNPLTSIVQFFQSALVSAPNPGMAMIVSNTCIILLITYLGITTFKKQSGFFDDWL